MLRRSFIVVLALGALGVAAPCRGQDTWQQEAGRLATLLNWHPGEVVAEIGASHGKLTLLAAQRVGPSGKVYSKELDPKALAHLEDLVS
jgi:tRNA A58 N-methylase Trm61